MLPALESILVLSADSGRAPASYRRCQRWVRAVPLTVWSIVALHTVLLFAYSVLLPTYRAPDEPQHIDVVRVIAHGHGYPDYNQQNIDPQVSASLNEVYFYRKSEHLLRAEARPRSDRPAYEDLPRTHAPQSNQIVQHPPLYYGVVGIGARVIDTIMPGDPFRAFDREVGLFRFLSCLLVAPLPLMVWLVCQRLKFQRPVAIAATMIPLTVPQLQHIGSSVNNDTMFILLTSLLTLIIVRIALGSTDRRTLLGAGAITGLAMFTKAFAFVYPLWLIAALVVGMRTNGRRLNARTLARDTAQLGATTFLFGAWWWLRNLIKFGEISPSVEFANRLNNVKPDFKPDWGYWFDEVIRRMGKNFFGDFGWFDVSIPVGIMLV